MNLTCVVDTKAAEQQLKEMARQIPFAVKTGVNRIGTRVQDVERAGIDARFTVRRQQFINQQGVKVLSPGFATNARPTITIGTDPKANFLAKFETGGDKTPTSGQSIAVPVSARRNKADIITAGNRPRQLLADLGPPPTGAAPPAKKRGRPKSIRSLLRAGKSMFVVRQGNTDPRSARLKPGIYQRLGKDHHANLKLWYRLTARTKIPPQLLLQSTAQRVVQAEGAVIMGEAVDLAIRTAK